MRLRASRRLALSILAFLAEVPCCASGLARAPRPARHPPAGGGFGAATPAASGPRTLMLARTGNRAQPTSGRAQRSNLGAASAATTRSTEIGEAIETSPQTVQRHPQNYSSSFLCKAQRHSRCQSNPDQSSPRPSPTAAKAKGKGLLPAQPTRPSQPSRPAMPRLCRQVKPVRHPRSKGWAAWPGMASLVPAAGQAASGHSKAQRPPRPPPPVHPAQEAAACLPRPARLTGPCPYYSPPPCHIRHILRKRVRTKAAGRGGPAEPAVSVSVPPPPLPPPQPPGAARIQELCTHNAHRMRTKFKAKSNDFGRVSYGQNGWE